MVLARLINVVAHRHWGQTVVAFHLWRMHTLALQFLLSEVVIEANVLDVANEVLVNTVEAFCSGTVLAHLLLEIKVLILGIY